MPPGTPPPPASLLLPLPMSLLYTPSVDNSCSRADQDTGHGFAASGRGYLVRVGPGQSAALSLLLKGKV